MTSARSRKRQKTGEQTSVKTVSEEDSYGGRDEQEDEVFQEHHVMEETDIDELPPTILERLAGSGQLEIEDLNINGEYVHEATPNDADELFVLCSPGEEEERN